MTEVGKCTLKVPNGKMLKVTVRFDKEKIETVSITGDFFMHPEDSIEELETSFKDTEYSNKSVSEVVKRFFGKEGITAFGITPTAVTDAIMRCKEEMK